MAHGPNLMTATSIQTNIARPSTANQLADDQARYRDGFAVAGGERHPLLAIPPELAVGGYLPRGLRGRNRVHDRASLSRECTGWTSRYSGRSGRP